jgi:hypothetical protein
MPANGVRSRSKWGIAPRTIGMATLVFLTAACDDSPEEPAAFSAADLAGQWAHFEEHLAGMVFLPEHKFDCSLTGTLNITGTGSAFTGQLSGTRTCTTFDLDTNARYDTTVVTGTWPITNGSVTEAGAVEFTVGQCTYRGTSGRDAMFGETDLETCRIPVNTGNLMVLRVSMEWSAIRVGV